MSGAGIQKGCYFLTPFIRGRMLSRRAEALGDLGTEHRPRLGVFGSYRG